MTSFGHKLYNAIDRVIGLYDHYGMTSQILLAEKAVIEVVNAYNKIEPKLEEWKESKSLELASAICEELCKE